jgi:Zn-dependent protease/predicted transcriptional regulator
VTTRFTVGPILGVRLVVTLSWLIVLGLVVFAMEAIGVFGEELDAPVRIGLALAVGVMFLVSLAIHELAHAVMARRFGVEVTEVGLSVVGSQGQLERRASTGRGEMAIALAGPAVSLVIGALLLWLALATGPSTEPLAAAIGHMIWLVGLANMVVGAVNLLPGLPFDGGRLVRGIVMSRTGDPVRATSLALQAGRLLAFAMMGFGIAIALTGAFIDGLWLLILGWLLIQSNRLYQRRHDIEVLVDGMSVGEVMEQEFEVVPPGLTVDSLLAQHEQRGGSEVYPVMQVGKLIGTIDVARVRRVPEKERLETRVEELMTPVEKVPLLTPTMALMEVLQSFDRSRADGLPVVDERAPGKLVGMLTREGLILSLREKRATLRSAEPPR